VPAAAGASDEGPDLSCLDHAFFRGEVSRLQARARAVQARLFRDAHNCGRSGGDAGARSVAGVGEVLATLESLEMGLGGDHPAPFDAEPLLHGARGTGAGAAADRAAPVAARRPAPRSCPPQRGLRRAAGRV
jgi:hypothetical protein